MKFLSVLFFFAIASLANAQTRDYLRRMHHHVDSVLQERNNKPPKFDTAYIARPGNRLTLKVRANLSGDAIHTKGTVKDVYSKADLSTDNKLTFSFAANYRGISAAIAVNPASIFGKKRDYEIYTTFYNPMISVDASYHNSHTLSGDMNRNGKFHLESGNLDMKVVNISAYYTFNHRRFSFPAAFTQTYIQKRSAGSWLAGFSFQGGTIKTSKNAPETYPDFKLEADHLGIGGGYGYNWVVGKKWLFHISVMPTVVVLNHNNLTINGEKIKAKSIDLNMIFNEHLAVVYQFSSKYFAGLTVAVNNSIFDDKNVQIRQNKWRSRLFFGIRL